MFSRFLQAICRSEILKSNPYLCEWLKCDDVKEFKKTTALADKMKFMRAMDLIVSESGTVPGIMTPNSGVFCSKMVDFVDSYQILYNEIIKCTKDINGRSRLIM